MPPTLCTSLPRRSGPRKVMSTCRQSGSKPVTRLMARSRFLSTATSSQIWTSRTVLRSGTNSWAPRTPRFRLYLPRTMARAGSQRRCTTPPERKPPSPPRIRRRPGPTTPATRQRCASYKTRKSRPSRIRSSPLTLSRTANPPPSSSLRPKIRTSTDSSAAVSTMVVTPHTRGSTSKAISTMVTARS